MKAMILTCTVSVFSFFNLFAQSKPIYAKLDSLLQLRNNYTKEINYIDVQIQDIVYELEKLSESFAKPTPPTSGIPSTSTSPSRTYSAPAASTSVTNSGSSSQRKYYTGPKGGCYYYSSSGKKVYVDRSYCN